jgi:hypothetical protein
VKAVVKTIVDEFMVLPKDATTPDAQVGGWVGMNRWGVRREWCRGQERGLKMPSGVVLVNNLC